MPVGRKVPRVHLDMLIQSTQAGQFFVARPKEGLKSWPDTSRPVELKQGVRSDHLIRSSCQRSSRIDPPSQYALTPVRAKYRVRK